MRRLLTALTCTALLAACGGGGGAEVSAPSPTPSRDGKVTLKDARTALERSPAAAWATVPTAYGPKPAMPAGFSAETGQYAYDYARYWLAGVHGAYQGSDPTTFLQQIDDVDDRIGLRDDLTGGRAFLYVDAFVRSARVVEPPRVKGAFTVDVGEADGEKTLRLTWKGTAVYLVQNIDGSGSLLPASRQITWSWFDGGDYPGVSTYASFGNVDICVISGTGLIKPTPGDIAIGPEYFSPERVTKQTEQEQAEQQAKIDAC